MLSVVYVCQFVYRSPHMIGPTPSALETFHPPPTYHMDTWYPPDLFKRIHLRTAHLLASGRLDFDWKTFLLNLYAEFDWADVTALVRFYLVSGSRNWLGQKTKYTKSFEPNIATVFFFLYDRGETFTNRICLEKIVNNNTYNFFQIYPNVIFKWLTLNVLMHIYPIFCLYLVLAYSLYTLYIPNCTFVLFPLSSCLLSGEDRDVFSCVRWDMTWKIHFLSPSANWLLHVTCLHSIVITEIDIVYISKAQFYLIHGTSKHASEMCKTTRKIIWDSFVHIVYVLVGLMQIKHFTSYVPIYLKVETITDTSANVQWRINAF